MPASQQKIALVSGANKGIGQEVARQLAAAGCTVYLGARHPELGKKAAATLAAEGHTVHCVQLDLLDENTMQQAAKTIQAAHGHLDILVNNAAVAILPDGPTSQAVASTMLAAMQTNFIGTVLLTQAMLPLLRLAPSASIVNVSSSLGSVTLAADPNAMESSHAYLAYAATKAALNMFTAQLAHELRETAIKVNASDPGYTATDLNNHQGYQTIPEGAAETIRLALLGPNGPTATFSSTQRINPW